jgi:hypothetical protein
VKRILLLSFTAQLITGACPAQTPRHAISIRTWTFGKQVWSNVIRMPECNKADFTSAGDTPDCRSYTSGSVTWYYYNWTYVDAMQTTLCPAPWRIPTDEDLEILAEETTANTLMHAWGLPGYADGMSIDSAGEYTYYWSSTPNGSAYACYLYCGYGNLDVSATRRFYGFQVRCVKNGELKIEKEKRTWTKRT